VGSDVANQRTLNAAMSLSDLLFLGGICYYLIAKVIASIDVGLI
jgi:hypothetical protein